MAIRLHKDYFFRILGLNSLSIILRIVMGVISTKLVSIYIGLGGISLLEHFRNLTSLSESFAQLGVQNGITKEIATSTTASREQRIFSTGLGLSGASTLGVMLVLGLFHRPILGYLFQSYALWWVLFIYLLCLPSLALQTLVISILNGKQFLKNIIWINSIGYGINILLSILLITQWGLEGAMLQMGLSPLLLWLFTWLFTQKLLPNIRYTLRDFDRSIARRLLGFTLMNLTSGTLIPLSFILIRSLVESHLGVKEAGIWSAMMRLSNFYMLFISSLCSLYFYPLLSKAKTQAEVQQVIGEYFKKFIPMVLLGMLCCYFCQNIIIPLLFTKDFLPLTHYFYLQLIGDFVKSCALIFGFLMIARRSVRFFILFECISIGGRVILTYFCLPTMGLMGAFIANIAALTVYLALVIAHSLKNKDGRYEPK